MDDLSKKSEEFKSTLNLYIGGIRLFGGVDPPSETIHIKVFLGKALVHEGVMTPPDPSTTKPRRVFVPKYLQIPLDGPETLEAISDQSSEQIELDGKKSLWLHIDFDYYPTDHPNRSQHGISLGAHDHPQTFR